VGYSLGVDLGTTFVAAALAVSSRVEMFTLGDRSEVTPAVVYLQEDGVLLTGEAVNSLRALSNPDRTTRVFKRRLGDPTPVILGGQPYSVTALLGTLLRDVLDRVVESEGGPPDRVVLTHPANWGPFRRALFEEVAAFAGLLNAQLVTEPEAAAARYAASRQLADGQTVAVYDLGGGTFDATVLRAVPGGVEILGTPEGVERLGGVDFDEAILGYVSHKSDGALNELDMRDPQTASALARLRQDCVLAKETLSVDTETTIPVFLPGRHFGIPLTRSDFEDLVRAQIDSTIGALSRTLRSAQVEPADLSAVLLVGGSSRIPLVARMVSAELGRPTVVDTHPKYAVALGAATLAAQAPASQVRTVLLARGERAPAPAEPPVSAQADPAATQVVPPPQGTPPQGPPAQAPPPQRPPAQRPPPGPQPGSQPQMPQPRGPQPHGPRPQGQPPQGPPWQVPPNQAPPPRQRPGAGQRPPGAPMPTHAYSPAHSNTIPPGRMAPVRPPAPPTQRPYPPPGAGPSPWQEPNRPPPSSAGPRGPARRLLLIGIAVAIILVLAVVVYIVLVRPPAAAATAAQLSLTSTQVKMGTTYLATATGFAPNEKVKFSWTGPTNGMMDDLPADATGKKVQGPILERDPPGNYVIIATGLTSGRSATARLQVLAADPPSGAGPDSDEPAGPSDSEQNQPGG
jgi:actin-like ATPase involved in cell morphogenesis